MTGITLYRHYNLLICIHLGVMCSFVCVFVRFMFEKTTGQIKVIDGSFDSLDKMIGGSTLGFLKKCLNNLNYYR